MNKRKTLRMTSILLALMMFFGMVSVLLVPAGVAGASDAIIDIVPIEDDEGTLASNYAFEAAEKYKVRIWARDAWWDDDREYSKVIMELQAPNLSWIPIPPSTTATSVDMTYDAASGDYYYDLTVTATELVSTGLYAARFKRVSGNWSDTVGTTKGLFWVYSAPTAVLNAMDLHTVGPKAVTADGWYESKSSTVPNYVRPGAEITFLTALMSGVTKSNIRIFNGLGNLIIEDNDLPDNSRETYDYTIPTNAVHDSEYEFTVVGTDGSERASGKCEGKVMYPGYDPSNLGTSAAKTGLSSIVKVDAKGPEVDTSNMIFGYGDYTTMQGMSTTSGNLFKEFALTDNIAFFEDYYITSPTNRRSGLYVGNKAGFGKPLPISDVGSGLNSTSKNAGVVNIDVYKDVVGAGSTTTIAATISNYNTKTGNGIVQPNGIGLVKNNTYIIRYVFSDNVGNKTTIKSGLVKVDAQYRPIRKLTAATNVINLVLGQEYTHEQLNAMIDMRIETPTDPHFPDAWFFNPASLDLSYFDIEFDADNQTITKLTPKKVGDTTGYATTQDVFKTGGVVATGFDNPVNSGTIFFYITDPSEPVTNITVSPKTRELKVGESFIPTATVLPTTATNPNIAWYSTNTAVATVDATTGVVTAIAEGNAQIYARSVENSGIQDHCEVTVGAKIVDPDPPATKIEGWKDENGNRYYYVDNQKITGWRKIEGSWYFFDYSNAAMRANGWLKEGGKWYYLNSNGTMKSAEWFKDNNGKWYWLKANGAMAAGWEKINGTWYYFNASGAMQTGWVNVRGIWYYMKSSGAMAEGWLQDGGSWYYLTPGGGAMVTGRVTINGRASNFATSGRWLGYV